MHQNAKSRHCQAISQVMQTASFLYLGCPKSATQWFLRAYWHQRIREEVGNEAAVVSMGDYNDEPFNRSLTEYSLAISSRKKVVSPYARNPWFYNLMWRFLGHDVATYYFSSTPNMLDQFLVSEGMLKDDSIFSVDEDSVEIIRFPEMLKGDYDAPREFGRPSGTLDEDGFSDHFPIGMVVREM